MNLESRNKKFGIKRFIRSFKYSIQGLKYAYLNEQSMFIHAIGTILVVLLGVILKISTMEWFILVSLLCVIAVIELLNTAVEAICDLITLEKNDLVKIAKDSGSASAFLVSIVTFVVSLNIFIPKIITLIGA